MGQNVVKWMLMLTSELVRPRLVMQAGRASTHPIPADYHYLAVANELASLFQGQLGRRRGELAEALREYEGDSLDYPVIRWFSFLRLLIFADA